MAPSPPVRRIALVDADAFFVAVARRTYGLTEEAVPYLIVGGSAEGRGVVTSASYPCRTYGVRAGIPSGMAQRLCPMATFVPVPGDQVSAASHAILDILRGFAPRARASSVDEMYLDLTGTEALYGNEPFVATGHRIRNAVRDATGYGVSLGLATNPRVAKLASEYAKPGKGGDGVFEVPPGGEAEFMLRFTLGDIHGIGPATAADLANRGLRTVADVRAMSDTDLVTVLGGGGKGRRAAAWLRELSLGIDDSPVSAHGAAKSVSRAETFSKDLGDDETLGRELLRLTDRVVQDLRDERMTTRTITVGIRDHDWVDRQKSRTVPEAVTSASAVLPVARELLAELRRARRVPARLLRVHLSGLAPHLGEQLPLFGAPVAPAPTAPAARMSAREDQPDAPLMPRSAGHEQERDRALADAVDAIRQRFGKDAVRPAATLPRVRDADDE